MDYRHTEDFARRMERAEFRARMLREQAIDDLFAAIGRWVKRLVARSEKSGRVAASENHGSRPAPG